MYVEGWAMWKEIGLAIWAELIDSVRKLYGQN